MNSSEKHGVFRDAKRECTQSELEDAVGRYWDLRRFQTYVLQAGARITKHARRLFVHVAQSVENFWMQLRECMSRWKLPDRHVAYGHLPGGHRLPMHISTKFFAINVVNNLALIILGSGALCSHRAPTSTAKAKSTAQHAKPVNYNNNQPPRE